MSKSFQPTCEHLYQVTITINDQEFHHIPLPTIYSSILIFNVTIQVSSFMTRHCECFRFVAACGFNHAATKQISKPPQAARSHEQLLNTSIAWESKNTVISSSSIPP